MKIKPHHFKNLADAIRPFNTPERRAAYAANGLSDKRYRWDLTYIAKLTPFICDELYPYLNDKHIDTALAKLTS